MTQVSRIPLSKELEFEMHTFLQFALADLQTKHDVQVFLDDLLTPTEKVMLGKRLFIAFLIEEGHDHRTISTMMHVSLSTISSVHFWLKNKGEGYRYVIQRMKKEKKWVEQINRVNDLIESLFTLHLPEKTRAYRAYKRKRG